MVDIDASSNLEENKDHLLGPSFYTISFSYCMTVSPARPFRIWEELWLSLDAYERRLEESSAKPEFREWYTRLKPHIHSSHRELLRQII